MKSDSKNIELRFKNFSNLNYKCFVIQTGVKRVVFYRYTVYEQDFYVFFFFCFCFFLLKKTRCYIFYLDVTLIYYIHYIIRFMIKYIVIFIVNFPFFELIRAATIYCKSILENWEIFEKIKSLKIFFYFFLSLNPLQNTQVLVSTLFFFQKYLLCFD